jgi:hypothetical protein
MIRLFRRLSGRLGKRPAGLRQMASSESGAPASNSFGATHPYRFDGAGDMSIAAVQLGMINVTHAQ